MINRVDGNYYNDYSQMKTVNTIQDNGEKFSLDYKQEHLQSEETGNKEKESKEAKKKKEAAERNGVKLELSQNSAYTGTKTEHTDNSLKAQARPEQKSLFDTIQEIITDIVKSVKDFFYKIWNDTDATQETQEQAETIQPLVEERKGLGEEEAETKYTADFTETLQDAEEIQRRDEARIDKEIQQYLHTGDLPQVISLLTDNGKKTIAKNSTLLTYYDRNGRVIEPSASDRERILHGDRGSRKL